MGFLDVKRSRFQVPHPVLIPRDKALDKLGVTRPGEWAFYCQGCRFRFSADCDASDWPPCLVCGLNWSLVATGHLPFGAAKQLEVCRLCKQASATETHCCSLCSSLIAIVKNPQLGILSRKAAMDALYVAKKPPVVDVVVVPNSDIQEPLPPQRPYVFAEPLPECALEEIVIVPR